MSETLRETWQADPDACPQCHEGIFAICDTEASTTEYRERRCCAACGYAAEALYALVDVTTVE